MSRVTVVDILTNARNRLDRPRGWTKNAMYRNNPNKDYNAVCALGALNDASNELNKTHQIGSLGLGPLARRVLSNAINGRNIKHRVSVIEWNDDKRRTKAEVLAAFDKAIRKARKDKI